MHSFWDWFADFAEFLIAATSEVLEYCHEIAVEMMVQFGLSRSEAVARINCHWRDTAFKADGDIVFHGMPSYWASRIYFEEVFVAGSMDRRPKPAPSRDSGCWNV